MKDLTLNEDIKTFKTLKYTLYTRPEISSWYAGKVNCRQQKKSTAKKPVRQPAIPLDKQKTLDKMFEKNTVLDKKRLDRICEKHELNPKAVRTYFTRKKKELGTVRTPEPIELHQLEYLEKFFAKNQYPNSHQYEEMADDIDLPKIKIRKWFDTQRQKQNRHKKRNDLNKN